MDFKSLLMTEEYDFLWSHKRLGNRIILLGLGGSYAYGTDNENSDIDFRGVALPHFARVDIKKISEIRRCQNLLTPKNPAMSKPFDRHTLRQGVICVQVKSISAGEEE